MGRVLVVVALGLLGVLAAASIGYASYLVSRDSVGLPVRKLDPAPRELAPTQQPPPARTASTRTATIEDRPRRQATTQEDRTDSVETGEDNSGRGRGRGRGRSGGDSGSDGGDSSGSGDSGSGGSGGGGSGSGSGSDD
jgi:hypothetical protein